MSKLHNRESAINQRKHRDLMPMTNAQGYPMAPEQTGKLELLCFPSLDHFKLALTSCAVPVEVQLRPCQASRLDKSQKLAIVLPCGRPGSSSWFHGAVQERLTQLGATVLGSDPASIQVGDYSCWLQVLPLIPVADEPDRSGWSESKHTILFRVAGSQNWTDLALEMLRLGNDRQAYRTLTDQDRLVTLLRVIDPPYYSLTRALHRDQQTDDLLAFREVTPRVWIQLGYTHPLAKRLLPPPGYWLLAAAPDRFHWVREEAFQELYHALEATLPAPVQSFEPQPEPARIDVHLRLTEGSTSATAQLWVIKERALEQLEALVLRSDDELLARFAFAVVESEPQPIVVLRTRPSRLPPPELILEATAYCEYQRLANLFVPLGMRITPPLRRDGISRLLAADARWLTWLESSDEQDNAALPSAHPAAVAPRTARTRSFIPMRIADNAFRPLTDWVHYLLDRNQVDLTTWSQAHQFDFEAFICRDDIQRENVPTPPPVVTPTRPGPQPSTNRRPQETKDRARSTASDSDQSSAKPDPKNDAAMLESARGSPNQLVEQLRQLEARFLECTEPVESAVRLGLWQRMGAIHCRLMQPTDTTISWANCAWHAQPEQSADVMRHWLMDEMRLAQRTRVDMHAIRSIIQDPAPPKPADISLVTVYAIHAVAAKTGRTELKSELPQLIQFLHQHERLLPIRLVWLGALAIYQLSAGDSLGLARVRDRCLERLYENGMQSEFDQPSFLRGAATSQSDHLRIVRMRYDQLVAAMTRWLECHLTACTHQYARLVYAYGLVRLGEVSSGRGLMQETLLALPARDPIHDWMGAAFEFRIQQAAQGSPSRDGLPAKMLKKLEVMERLDRYKIDRLRQHSRILEPYERIDAYRRWHRRYSDDLYRTLAELKDLTDSEQIRKRLNQLQREHSEGLAGLRVLASALEFAPRLGDQFARRQLERAQSLLSQCDDPIELALLLQRALVVAAHFGHNTIAATLITSLRTALPKIVQEYLKLDNHFNPQDKERIETVEALLLQSFKGMRKLGMREAMGELYAVVERIVEEDRIAAGRKSGGSTQDRAVAKRWHLLLCVASGWYYYGRQEEANEIIVRVGRALTDGQLATIEQRRLAVAYTQSVALAPTEQAIGRLLQLYKVDSSGQRVLSRIEDTMTTSSHFSVSQFELIESTVLSLLSEQSNWDAASQLWLDQDEFSVRQRIHADMRTIAQAAHQL